MRSWVTRRTHLEVLEVGPFNAVSKLVQYDSDAQAMLG